MSEEIMQKAKPVIDLKARQSAPVHTPTGLSAEGTREITGSLNALLADFYALYFKTKNFHWHMSGPHFRDYHLLLDEHADQIFGVTDDIAERVRKIGGNTLHSVGEIKSHTRILDNDAAYVTPEDMLAELKGDNSDLIARMREAHELTSEHGDVATTSLLENWIDHGERRVWFLFEATRRA
jgi:starvation-inducible DNA-binding protein